MTNVMNKDETGVNPANKVTGEVLLVKKGEAQKLEHSIFFEPGFLCYENPADKLNSLLRRGLDFDFTDEDTIATEISNKNCWKKIVVYKDIPHVYVDYQVYGDFVTAELINNVKAQSVDVADRLSAFNGMLEADKQDLANHKADTKAHGASSAVLSNSLALRTATGALKAADAVEQNDLVNLKTLEAKQTSQDAAFDTKLKEKETEILQRLIASEAALTKYEMEDGTLDPADPHYETQLQSALDTRVNEINPYRNALRNEHGSLSVPTATKETEAVPLSQATSIATSIAAEKIDALVAGAPEALNTLKEISDALTVNPEPAGAILNAISTAKTEAISTASADAQTKATAAVASAKSYADSLVANLASKDEMQTALSSKADADAVYTKSEIDASQEEQDDTLSDHETRLDALESAASGALYDFTETTAVPTGDKVKTASGTKYVYRMYYIDQNIDQNIDVIKQLPTTFTGIFDIYGIVKTNCEMKIENAFDIKAYSDGVITLQHKLQNAPIAELKLIIEFY